MKGVDWPDEKSLAILALFGIAITVIGATGASGLDVVTNIVCSLGGLVTGVAIQKRQNGG